MTDPTNRPVSDWLSDLEISEAQLTAGQTIPAEPVLARLRGGLARFEGEADAPARREASRRR